MSVRLVIQGLTFLTVHLSLPLRWNQPIMAHGEEQRMAKTVNGTTYRTIADVTKELRTSVKTINKLVSEGVLPAPEVIENGGAPFRSYDDDFFKKGEAHFKKKAEEARKKSSANIS